MTDQIIFKEFDSTDIVAGKSKPKYFPAWSDVTSDVDTTQQAIISTFYINEAQATASIEGLYYWNIYQENPRTILDTAPQFSIAFGQTCSVSTNGTIITAHNPNISASGYLGGGNLGLSPAGAYDTMFSAAAIYRQMVNATTNGDAYTYLTYVDLNGITQTMTNIYVVALSRSRIKDYIDQNTWQLNLSGSKLIPLKAASTSLTNNPMAYNVVVGALSDYDYYSGSYGSNFVSASSVVGKFYADKGLIVLDANMLYASGALLYNPSSFFGGTTYQSSQVFANLLTAMIHQPNTGSLTSTMGTLGTSTAGSTLSGSYFKARSVEKVQSTHYFVRARNNEFNNSTNPTWISGSNNEVLTVFYDDPKTFISSIGLYDGFPGQDSTGQVVAIAKTSKPIPKDSVTEALIKVRLDFVWFITFIPTAYYIFNTLFT